jgi:serine/threonine protein kinase
VFIIEEIFYLWDRLTVHHFDIKTDNIMLDFNHKLKLVDMGLVLFRKLFLFDAMYQFFYLPRKNIYYPLTYNETDTNDDFAFAIMILNILLCVNNENVVAAIGDEVVNRSNVEVKLEKLGIKWNKGSSETRILREPFKKTILTLL